MENSKKMIRYLSFIALAFGIFSSFIPNREIGSFLSSNDIDQHETPFKLKNQPEKVTSHIQEISDTEKVCVTIEYNDELEANRRTDWHRLLNDYSAVSISKKTPFVTYEYDSKADFLSRDYKFLLNNDSQFFQKVFMEPKMADDSLASRSGETESTDYKFSQALNDIGINNNHPYTGKGIKIGTIENGLPLNYSNYIGKTYHSYGINGSYHEREHSFVTSSIFAGNGGIATDAEVFFAGKQYVYGNGVSFTDCIDWMVDNDVDVINISTGNETGYYDSVAAYFDYVAHKYGITVVCSAGNDGKYGDISSPSMGINVLSVASTDSNRKVSKFSSGSVDSSSLSVCKPNLSAPGGKLANLPNCTKLHSGTSFSAPMVTGMVALLMEEFPDLQGHPDRVISLLESSCVLAEGQTKTFDHDAGFGIVNYHKARTNHANMTSFSSAGGRNGKVIYDGTNHSFHLGFDSSIQLRYNLFGPSSQTVPEDNDTAIIGPIKSKLDLMDSLSGALIAEGVLVQNGQGMGSVQYLNFTNKTYQTDHPTTEFYFKVSLDGTIDSSYSLFGSLVYYRINSPFRITSIPAGMTMVGTTITKFSPSASFDGTLLIPDSVTEIDNTAFNEISSIQHVVFSPNSKLSRIGNYCFLGCQNLKTFIIPSAVERIGWAPFNFCPSIEIYSPLSGPKAGWSSTWDICFVDYEKMAEDLGKENINEEDYYTRLVKHWNFQW